MTDFEPLSPTFPERERRMRDAKQIRADYMYELVSGLLQRFRTQRRSLRLAEISGAAAAVAAAAFWTMLIAAPGPLEADVPEPQVSPTELTLGAPRDLPSFEDRYQRHTG